MCYKSRLRAFIAVNMTVSGSMEGFRQTVLNQGFFMNFCNKVELRLVLAILFVTLGVSVCRAARFVDCASCHGAISAEWRTSAHAQS